VTTVRESLIGIVKIIHAAHRSHSLNAQFSPIVDQLEVLIEPAVNDERDTLRYLVGVMNILLEMRYKSLPSTLFEPFLLDIEKSLDKPASLVSSFLKGEEAQAEATPEIGIGCTMIKWNDFVEFYAPRYGVSRSPSELEKLWQRIEKGELRIPREDLHFSSASGVVWMTDEKALHAQCASTIPSKIDGTKAYDALGLDWATGWTYAPPVNQTRAVVLVALVSHRRTASGGLRVPTSIDAWGGFGFVPKQAPPPSDLASQRRNNRGPDARQHAFTRGNTRPFVCSAKCLLSSPLHSCKQGGF
jgi:hypothetical protein